MARCVQVRVAFVGFLAAALLGVVRRERGAERDDLSDQVRPLGHGVWPTQWLLTEPSSMLPSCAMAFVPPQMPDWLPSVRAGASAALSAVVPRSVGRLCLGSLAAPSPWATF